MLFEAKRATFNPIAYPLENVKAGTTKTGVVLNFGVPNQMVETNNVLEVYIAKGAVPEEGKEPKLQLKVLTGEAEETLAVVQSSEVFLTADLVEGFVLYKAALPDKCGKLVRIDLVNGAGAGNDFADGLIVGVVRPI